VLGAARIAPLQVRANGDLPFAFQLAVKELLQQQLRFTTVHAAST
jgi:hypothetical protein